MGVTVKLCEHRSERYRDCAPGPEGHKLAFVGQCWESSNRTHVRDVGMLLCSWSLQMVFVVPYVFRFCLWLLVIGIYLY